MENETRGIIRNRERSRQINDFRNLRYKNITPTDIDGFVEIEGRAYIYFEVKYKDAIMPFGQKLAFERTALDHHKAGKPCLVMTIEHDVADTEKDVDVGNCYVREIFVSTDEHPEWRQTNKRMSAQELMNLFINFTKIASPNAATLEEAKVTNYSE